LSCALREIKVASVNYVLAFRPGPRWTPGIGDPTFAGWATVVLYFVAFGLCARALRNTRMEGVERSFWAAVTLLLGALGINKQLDLQTLFTQLARSLAWRQGWYEQRREAQILFAAAAVCVGLVAAAFLLWLMRRSAIPTRIVIVGCCLLIVFVLVRALSFHHFDRFIGYDILGVRMNWAFEIGGILIVIAGATLQLRRYSRA
jgi:hypothetical protein